MNHREELVWAGGLFEGEGCFYVQNTADRARQGSAPRCRASLSMTDEDVVRRFGRAIGLGVVKGPYQHSRQPRNKPHWDWYVSGLEETQAVVSMLWTGLGLRRRARAVEVLNATPLVPRRGRRRRNEALN